MLEPEDVPEKLEAESAPAIVRAPPLVILLAEEKNWMSPLVESEVEIRVRVCEAPVPPVMVKLPVPAIVVPVYVPPESEPPLNVPPEIVAVLKVVEVMVAPL